jgi:hypothetical protein
MEYDEKVLKEREIINRVKARELIDNWKAPENFKLTAKQVSLRLPIIIMAKISALCELHSKESRSKIIADLLSLAFELIEAELDGDRGMACGDEKFDWEYSETYRFSELTKKYIEELKKEAGIETGRKEAKA